MHPNDWYLVIREAVVKAVEFIQSGESQNLKYDHNQAVFIKSNL